MCAPAWARGEEQFLGLLEQLLVGKMGIIDDGGFNLLAMRCDSVV